MRCEGRPTLQEAAPYKISKGFLSWEFMDGLEKGILSYSIETERFQKFQELVKKNQPTCFEELEVFLI